MFSRRRACWITSRWPAAFSACKSEVNEVRNRCRALGLIPVRHPFGKEINPGLQPRAFPSRRWGRHDGTADPANPVVDGGRVRFHVVIAPEIECLAHRVNVSLCEER